ncbi:hypothetical protein C4D60_Mb03t21100 [Musa balbisiana]|uniref:Cyanobacterial aminoacyl-tRNA synthetase CAAD domain-containing protein n=1 Tax=Musa balbisiana TaxID=52838 RepID=A0A4S8JCJ1_MUSBA|nr:hypothetical protein C4D60_Mb03t21100 [Musa balbisiana]
MAAFGASSPAATAVLGGACLSSSRSAALRTPVLHLPPPPRCHFSTLPLPLSCDVARFSSLRVKASSSSEESSGSVQTDELLADLKEKWDSIENKSTVFLYGGGALLAVWLSAVVISAVNSVPLVDAVNKSIGVVLSNCDGRNTDVFSYSIKLQLPKIMELVGLGYTGWFVYRYLLYKDSRKELATDIEDLKKKIAGTGE